MDIPQSSSILRSLLMNHSISPHDSVDQGSKEPLPCNNVRWARFVGAGIFRAPGIDQNSHMAATKRDLEMITHDVYSVVDLCIRILFLKQFPFFLLFPSLAFLQRRTD